MKYRVKKEGGKYYPQQKRLLIWKNFIEKTDAHKKFIELRKGKGPIAVMTEAERKLVYEDWFEDACFDTEEEALKYIETNKREIIEVVTKKTK